MGNIKYTGILAEPIYRQDYWARSILTEGYEEQAISAALKERFKALFEFYGIEYDENPTNGALLAIQLASEHVPGFQILERRNRVGRPSYWSYDNKRKLINEVNSYIERNPNHSYLDACRNLLKRNGGKYGNTTKAESLFTKFNEFSAAQKKAIETCRANGDLLSQIVFST